MEKWLESLVSLLLPLPVRLLKFNYPVLVRRIMIIRWSFYGLKLPSIHSIIGIRHEMREFMVDIDLWFWTSSVSWIIY